MRKEIQLYEYQKDMVGEVSANGRTWQAMFEGRIAGKGILTEEVEGLYNIAYSISNEKERIISDARTELITVMTHCMKPRESSTWFDMFYDGKNPPIVERRTMRYIVKK